MTFRYLFSFCSSESYTAAAGIRGISGSSKPCTWRERKQRGMPAYLQTTHTHVDV